MMARVQRERLELALAGVGEPSQPAAPVWNSPKSSP
jgi:hypothetical protein